MTSPGSRRRDGGAAGPGSSPSQSRMEPSSPAEETPRPGPAVGAGAGFLGPSQAAVPRPVAASQRTSGPSAPPVMTLRPSDEKTSDRTTPGVPHRLTSAPDAASQTATVPPAPRVEPPAATRDPSGLKATSS